jgi:integrase
MASMSKNTRGKGWIVYYNDRKGLPQTKTLPTKKEAKAFKSYVELTIEAPVKAKITWQAAADRFIETLRAKALSPNTIDALSGQLTNHVNPVWGKRFVHELDDDDERSLLQLLCAYLDRRYADDIMRLVRRVRRDSVVNENAAGGNPDATLLAVRSKAAGQGLPDTEHLRQPTGTGNVTPEDLPAYGDVRTLLLHSTGVARIIFHLGFLAGLRSSEMLGLKRMDIDFEGTGRIHIRRIRRRTKKQHALATVTYVPPRKRKKVKSEESERSVEMDPVLRTELQAWLATLGDDPECVLFPGAFGPTVPMVPDTLQYHISHAQKRLGIGQVVGDRLKAYSLHDLRDTCVSLWIHVGYDVADVSSWIGHADVGTTILDYARVLRDVDEHREERMALAMA